MNTNSPSYPEKVYAGVLGKIIGVYLGRPFEGWLYPDILKRFGYIENYVHEMQGVPLVVTDDDISGTFTFIRALEDHGHSLDLTAEQIGNTWLNTIIERRSILWWGGFGISTEHTAYLRLKDGIPAPRSGSIELNGKTVAEQIGAQIFIDSWGLISPGNPAQAANLARKAGSVSHDGEALYGAQMIAAMVAQAFVENKVDPLIDAGLTTIPDGCLIARMIGDIRKWHSQYPGDWEANFHRIEENFGYDQYGGGCHMIPNHALIILALLHGRGNFRESLKIVNTCGWDTDCNSGNVGCILGVLGGIDGLSAGPDYRGPVADQIFLPQADGGRAITDAVREAFALVNIARRLNGQKATTPKNGARFHFSLPGSVQGFRPIDDHTNQGSLNLENAPLPGSNGRSLAFRYNGLAAEWAVFGATQTWLKPADFNMPGYALDACPTLYPGQTVTARVIADRENRLPISVGLGLQIHTEDGLSLHCQTSSELKPGCEEILSWKIQEIDGYPIAEVGLCLNAEKQSDGTIYLDSLTWEGAPDLALPVIKDSTLCERTWIRDTLAFGPSRQKDAYWISAYDKPGLAYTGSRDWTDYRISASISSKVADSCGLLARVQGLRRYYALELTHDRKLRIRKMRDESALLAEVPLSWEPEADYRIEFVVSGPVLQGLVNGRSIVEATDAKLTLENGAAGFIVEKGVLSAHAVEIRPIRT